MAIKTHLAINHKLCGTPVSVTKNTAIVEMTVTDDMAVDDRGLVHGGFVFGLADYAAMLAVNHPHVVLAGSTCKFLMPIKTGETIRASATVALIKNARYTVVVKVTRKKDTIFSGEFTCVVLDEHVLEQ